MRPAPRGGLPNVDGDGSVPQYVTHRRQKQDKPVVQAFIGIQLLVGLVAVYFWNFLPI